MVGYNHTDLGGFMSVVVIILVVAFFIFVVATM